MHFFNVGRCSGQTQMRIVEVDDTESNKMQQTSGIEPHHALILNRSIPLNHIMESWGAPVGPKIPSQNG